MPVQGQTKNVMLICPNLKCRKVLRVPAQYRGQCVKCHYCGTTLEVPLAQGEKKTGSPGQ